MGEGVIFGPRSRVLVMAPHPDDECIAAGGLLQRAVAAGAAVRVLFLTSGEDNPWPQRVIEARWRIGPRQRERWGARRQAEALAALVSLGLCQKDVRFLSFCDQGVTGSLEGDPGSALARVAAEFDAFRPTHLVHPSLLDCHPDHSGGALLADGLLRRARSEGRAVRGLAYVVHGPQPAGAAALSLELTAGEFARKRDALGRHFSQLLLSRRRMLAYARQREVFFDDEGAGSAAAPHPVRRVGVVNGEVELTVVSSPRLAAWGPASLHVYLADEEGGGRSLRVDMSTRTGESDVWEIGGREAVGEARVSGDSDARTVRLPAELFAGAAEAFVKVRRRFGLYDEAGWRPLGLAALAPAIEEQVRGRARLPEVWALVPCYNIAGLCGEVVRAAAARADRVLAINDGSSDETERVLREVAGDLPGRVEVLSFPVNRGKGAVLLDGFRHALRHGHAGIVVTLDGDGQHRPEDIPRLAHRCFQEHADLVIGERTRPEKVPLRSRFGNSMATRALRLLYPACPTDTQSGMRAHSRRFLERVVRQVGGSRYEVELKILLLALRRGDRVGRVSIPTIYLDGNRSSHFRPVVDSFRIVRTFASSLLAARPAAAETDSAA